MSTHARDNVLEYAMSTEVHEWLCEQVAMVNVIPGEKRASWYARGPCSVCGSYVKFWWTRRSRWYTRLSPLFSKGWESDAKIQKFFARWRDETRMDGAVAIIQDRSEPSNTFLHWEIEWRVSLISTLSFALRKKKNKWQWLKNQEWLWPRRHVIVFFFSSFPLSLTQKWIFLPFLQIE